MGTSTSHTSPDTLGWRSAKAGYQTEIPVERVAQEVWRASQSQDEPIISMLSDRSIFMCYQAVLSSNQQATAVGSINKILFETKSNSIVAELAKRAIVEAFRAEDPGRAWLSSLFAHVTDYFVSRDLSGFVGHQFRNRSISDAVGFKSSIRSHVKSTVSDIPSRIETHSSWRDFVKTVVQVLSGTQ